MPDGIPPMVHLMPGERRRLHAAEWKALLPRRTPVQGAATPLSLRG